MYTHMRAQVDEEPSIRANTTVLLGNLAVHLGEATCKRVLLNAFTRALKVSSRGKSGKRLPARSTSAPMLGLWSCDGAVEGWCG